MAAFAPALAPPGLVQPPPQASAAELAKRTQIKDAARQFETQFLSQMLQHMFAGVSTDGPFGGGFGEEMFRSIMTEAMAKQMTKAGGIGLADKVQHEILKLQGLT
jgi:Rod binding domain-containing protein